MNNSLPAPLDVKLMNLTSSLLLVAFVLLALGALAGWAMAHPLFAIRGVTVAGDVNHNNALTLRANVAPQLRGTFLTIDLAAARRAFETMPWVRRAVVRREFPNRLKAILQEHQAVGYWGAEGDSTLVNSFGEVFEANVDEVDQDELPRLDGPQGQSAQVLAMYRALLPLFGRLELSIEALELTGHGSWRAKLDTGAQIELGRGTEDEVMARTQRFLGTVTQVASRYGRTVAALESADLRHQEGYAVRLRGVSTVLPEAQKAQQK
ncbi:MAG: cell division protein FtsQ [Curvibacter sp. GWA2_64_110]|nr:MAG: cell division protein FtsQ [Curvibacter sp. GWA2_64_110]HCY15646.1 cell division protein FtsQ [Curvibacter sp.]